MMGCWRLHRVAGFVSIIIVALCLMVGCDVSENRVVYKDVNVREWDESATIAFTHDGKPRRCDIDILLHVNRDFDARQCAFEISTITPDSLRYAESVTIPISEMQLSETEHFFDVCIPYRRDVGIDKNGEYKIIILPLVPLSDVEAVGVNFQLK